MEVFAMRRTSGIVMAVTVLSCLLGPPNAVGECMLTPSGMISLWSGDLDARDVVGGYDGILVDGTEAGVPGQVGGAFSFDGDNDYVNVASNPVFDLTDALTMEAWIFLTTLKWDQKILSYYLPYEMGVFNDKLELVGQADTTHREAPGGTVLLTNTWYHVVTTWDGETITSYVNGALDRSVAYSGPLDTGTNNFSIGRASNGGINFDGLIDEAALYARALTAGEVEEHYQNGLLHQEFCIFIDGFEN
jgi:hypothetical protein